MKQLFIPPQLEFILRIKVKHVIIKFKNSKPINRKTLKEPSICPSCIDFYKEIKNLDESLSFGGTKCFHISGSIFLDTHSYNIFVNEVNGKKCFSISTIRSSVMSPLCISTSALYAFSGH